MIKNILKKIKAWQVLIVIYSVLIIGGFIGVNLINNGIIHAASIISIFMGALGMFNLYYVHHCL